MILILFTYKLLDRCLEDLEAVSNPNRFRFKRRTHVSPRRKEAHSFTYNVMPREILRI